MAKKKAPAGDTVRSGPLPAEYPGVHWYDEEEKEAVLRVIDRRSPFRFYGVDPLGEVAALEKEFAERLQVKHALAVSSGTAGLTTALAALGVGPGQEVLIPGFLWVATVGAVVRHGAIPVLVEIDDTYNMDPEDLGKKITPRSTVVIAIHMAGAAANMPEILQVAKRHNLRVLEDCAQANGARMGGQFVGTFGDVAVFSFQVNKNVTAGEGGMVVTNDEDLYLRCSAAHDLGVPWIGGEPQVESDVAIWGCGARMSELAGAVMRVQLRKLDRITLSMRSSKREIKERIGEIPGITFRRVVDRDGDSGAFMIFGLEDGAKARAFAGALKAQHLNPSRLADFGLHVYYNIRALVEKRSISPDGFPWTHPANQESVYGYGRGALPRSDDLFDRSLLLPVPSCLSDRDIEDVAAILERAAGGG